MALPTGARNDLERRATSFKDLAYRFLEKAGGAIGALRLLKIASDGDAEEAAFNGVDCIGANGDDAARVAGELVSVALGRCFLIADQAIVAGQRLKPAAGGRAIQLVDADLTGTTVEDNVGLAFTNQPANDGVEVLSSNAADTTQKVTIYYTRNGQGDTVFSEEKNLNGTTVVSFTHTDIEKVLGVEKSAATAGTVTFREASGDLTIITLAAGTLSSGIITVTAGQEKAYNAAPTAVADGATTKVVGIIGTDENDVALMASKALNGATAVTFGDTFKTVTKLLVGDLESARTVTVKVGAEDSRRLQVGKALEAAAAKGDRFNALVIPQ